VPVSGRVVPSGSQGTFSSTGHQRRAVPRRARHPASYRAVSSSRKGTERHLGRPESVDMPPIVIAFHTGVLDAMGGISTLMPGRRPDPSPMGGISA
jgi:hypothetical protein